MILIEDHLCNFCRKHILDDSDGFAGSSIPDLDVLLTSDENLKALITEERALDCLIIGEVRKEGPGVLEDCELTCTTDQSPMLGYSPDALDLMRVFIGDVESLNATVVLNVPQFDHTFGISRDETIQVRKAINSD